RSARRGGEAPRPGRRDRRARLGGGRRARCPPRRSVVRPALRVAGARGMSGIAAILERNGAPTGEKRILAMLGRLRKRGPDRSSYCVEGSAALAQAMLATTPEDALDRQPLASRSGKQWIVADARVDNRAELLRLRSEAAQAADRISDAALILLSYERWG